MGMIKHKWKMIRIQNLSKVHPSGHGAKTLTYLMAYYGIKVQLIIMGDFQSIPHNGIIKFLLGEKLGIFVEIKN